MIRKPRSFQDWANAIISPIMDKVEEYQHLIHGPYKAIWDHSLANELDQLTQGVGNRIKGTDSMQFILKTDLPL